MTIGGKAGPVFARRQILAGAAAIPLLSAAGCATVGSSAPPQMQSFTLRSANGREVAISEWSPVGEPVGTILFSHGAGSAPDKYLQLIEPWVAAGWRFLGPLHVDSREHPHAADYPGLLSWSTRIEDMRLLSAHVGDKSYVAAGHSYGGLVALTLGGAAAVQPEGVEGPLSDPKVSSVVAFSPPAPIPVLISEEGYAKLAVPALVQTGTLDIVPGITGEDPEGWRGHLVPFTAAAPGNARYGLVLEGVNHYFGGAICDLTRPGPPQLDCLADAVEIARLFLFAHGRGEVSAKAALDARLSDALPVRLLKK